MITRSGTIALICSNCHIAANGEDRKCQGSTIPVFSYPINAGKEPF